jgi:hypothetical protein
LSLPLQFDKRHLFIFGFVVEEMKTFWQKQVFVEVILPYNYLAKVVAVKGLVFGLSLLEKINTRCW